MDVVIAGGHGKIARILTRMLTARGGKVRSIVRNPDHSSELELLGSRVTVLDLETAGVEDVARVLDGADAAVFAAGAGPNSDAERKLTLDRDGAVLLARAAERAGVRRYLMVSAIHADAFDPQSTDVFQVYLRAKSEADAALRASSLDWTIIRPGTLTGDPGTGRIRVADELPDGGEIPREDVATVLMACLDTPSLGHTQFEVVSGDHTMAAALASVAKEWTP